MTKRQPGEDRSLRSVLEVKNAYLPALAKSERDDFGERLAERNAEMTARALRENVGSRTSSR